MKYPGNPSTPHSTTRFVSLFIHTYLDRHTIVVVTTHCATQPCGDEILTSIRLHVSWITVSRQKVVTGRFHIPTRDPWRHHILFYNYTVNVHVCAPLWRMYACAAMGTACYHADGAVNPDNGVRKLKSLSVQSWEWKLISRGWFSVLNTVKCECGRSEGMPCHERRLTTGCWTSRKSSDDSLRKGFDRSLVDKANADEYIGWSWSPEGWTFFVWLCLTSNVTVVCCPLLAVSGARSHDGERNCKRIDGGATWLVDLFLYTDELKMLWTWNQTDWNI